MYAQSCQAKHSWLKSLFTVDRLHNNDITIWID